MTDKNPKIVKTTLIIIALCVAGGFAVNWFLTYRLQSRLNEKLTEEVLKATDGFYRCTFEELSVGLFSGELSLKGVNLEPDSLAFSQWKAGDTLPNVYYKINLGEIHFRGVNLTWLWSYSDLHFSLFELNSPDVKIVQPVSSRIQKSNSGKELKTLYEVVSPYIEQLTVGRINLNDANISYIVEDSVSPIIYSLREAGFRAYNFRLDKNSAISGKLLYSDHFEFKADKPQQLLYSDQVILETDNIKLSTIESLIKIEGVRISPKESFWEDRMQQTGGYLKAQMAAVVAEGVEFHRENAQNYLHASSFNIKSTDIQYFSVKGKNKTEDKDNQPSDTATDQTWSLYELISPILSSISVDKIGIEKTKFNYTLTQKGQTDIYTLYEFDFHANKFLIDSLSEQHKKFWYVDNFILTGANINGMMESNNSNVSATRLYLNTAEKQFHIADIKVKPLSTTLGKDYMSGGIKRISINGLDYNTGVSAEELKVDSFNIKYYKVSAKKPQLSVPQTAESPDDIFEMLNPYANYLSVKKIDLNDASLEIYDRTEKQVYRLQHLDFYATDFLIDDNTRRTSRYLFTCNDVGLTFRNFDNILPGGYYKLQIGNADVSTLAGRLKFEDVKLIPQTDTWNKAPATYYNIKIPLIDINGFDNDAFIAKDIAKLKSFRIVSPDIKIAKLYNEAGKNKGDSAKIGILPQLKALRIDSLNISDINILSSDQTNNDSIQTALKSLKLAALDWHIGQGLNIGDFILESPDISYTTHNADDKKGNSTTLGQDNSVLSLIGKNINIGNFSISHPQINISQPDSKIGFKTERLGLASLILSGKNLNLSSFDLVKPQLQLVQDYRIKTDTLPGSPSGTDLYNSLSHYFDKADIGRINIEKAGLDYSHTLNGRIVKHQEINTTNLKVDKLTIDTKLRNLDAADFHFNTKDLHLPIMDGFYTLDFDRIDLNKRQAQAEISGIKMTSTYPKMDFSYIHPTHKDWFDVSVGNVLISGLDYTSLFKDGILRATDLEMADVVLQNLKNKQIYTPPKMQPMIYTKIQELPIGLDIDTANIRNFTVVYDELPKDSEEMGRIFFENMNGRFSKLTNIASYPTEYMHVNIDGKFMETGNFTARWDIPVSPDYDCFILEASLKDFDLKALNPIFIPLAKAEMNTGYVNEFRFRTEATSMDAHANMLLLYNGLRVDILKNPETQEKKKLLSSLANMVIKSNNPDKKGKLPRMGNVYIERDPYHSSFNYFWQIMQPALVESVGVSQGKQNFFKGVAGFFTKVKDFFTGEKDDKKPEESVK